MNKSDCFILDTGKGKTIFVFMPPGSSFYTVFFNRTKIFIHFEGLDLDRNGFIQYAKNTQEL